MSPTQWSAKTLHRSGTILGGLSLLAFLILGAWFWQANAAQQRTDTAQRTRLSAVELGGKNLSTALDKQRAQFLACAAATPGTPGCSAPVAPPAAQVAPQIVTGPVGPQGYQGLQGAKGDTGAGGLTGKTGLNGTGTNGTNGADGTPGPAGAQGDPGPAGTNGTNGTNGADGQSAYPFTFSFTTTAGLTYTCTLPAVNTPGACTEVPTATPTTGGTP